MQVIKICNFHVTYADKIICSPLFVAQCAHCVACSRLIIFWRLVFLKSVASTGTQSTLRFRRKFRFAGLHIIQSKKKKIIKKFTSHMEWKSARNLYLMPKGSSGKQNDFCFAQFSRHSLTVSPVFNGVRQGLERMSFWICLSESFFWL